jgi:uncharacterized protein YbjT (DUF2867 family)
MVARSKVNSVTVFGGSGFLGRRIVEKLADKGFTTVVVCRHPDNVVTKSQQRQHGNIRSVYADIRDETSVALAITDCDAVINAVGLYTQSGFENFEEVHEIGALNVAHQASLLGIRRLVHISGIGASVYSGSNYVRARAKGELLVRDVFSRTTILRPSVLFAPNDGFINSLSKIAQYTPVIPLFGRGLTKLQPVYVDDVADAAVNVLVNSDAPGNVYELGGPDVFTYRALIRLLLKHTKQQRLLLPVPFPLWALLAIISSKFRTPALTEAQVTLMRQDNVVSNTAKTFQDLEIEPTPLADILPKYAFSHARTNPPGAKM